MPGIYVLVYTDGILSIALGKLAGNCQVAGQAGRVTGEDGGVVPSEHG